MHTRHSIHSNDYFTFHLLLVLLRRTASFSHYYSLLFIKHCFELSHQQVQDRTNYELINSQYSVRLFLLLLFAHTMCASSDGCECAYMARAFLFMWHHDVTVVDACHRHRWEHFRTAVHAHHFDTICQFGNKSDSRKARKYETFFVSVVPDCSNCDNE